MSNDSEDKLSGFAELLRHGLGDLLTPEATNFVEMMTEDGIVEFPYAPDGAVHSVTGRAELNSYLEHLNGVIELLSFSEPRVHHTTDPHVVILEFNAQGRGVKTAALYKQTYISVITVRNGHIEHYRDYWNPLVGQQEMSGLESPTAEQHAEARP